MDVIHGIEIVDSYRWLEDQDSPETRDWLDAQNAYTLSRLGDQPERSFAQRRLAELLRVDRVTAPRERQGRYFLQRKRAEDDLWIHYVREGLEGEDRVLIDPHPLSQDHTTTVEVGDISQDGKLLIYGIRRGGADETEIRLRDVDTGKEVVAEGEDAIEGFSLVGGQLFVRTLHNVISRIERYDLAGERLAVLLTSGDRDTRVPPLQARKMTARLQAATASEHSVMLRYDTKAGHAGGRPTSKAVEDLSIEAAFLFSQLGLEPGGTKPSDRTR